MRDDAIIYVAAKLGGFSTDLPNLIIADWGNSSPTPGVRKAEPQESCPSKVDFPANAQYLETEFHGVRILESPLDHKC